ncbi:acyl CoA binding protein-domain-containing protein [Infundibulicybe gibba]|nr:acyl CoA binding protein-domain-containing protein [Infundibulicybe gibba]
MASHVLIDAQFDRAVEIVQGLPKTGPIQTDYDEKLTMYSLYKQATVGNVISPRPGLWDVLGRAKWDAWAKHQDLDSYEAKWLYVDALMKVLRKYSDKTVAMTLVQELESYGGDPANIVMSRTMSKSPGSDASGSTASMGALPTHHTHMGTQPQNNQSVEGADEDDVQSPSEEDSGDEAEENPAPIEPTAAQFNRPQSNRPQSSLSSHRYRTPMAGSLAMSPPLAQNIPTTQPLPSFETPSAFIEPSLSARSSLYPTTSSLVGQFTESSRAELASPHQYPIHVYGGQIPQGPLRPYGPAGPASRPTLERAVESVQAHLAALAERLESLESVAPLPSQSHSSLSPRGAGSPSWGPGRGSLNDGRNKPRWDIDDLGMWSIVLNPVSRGLEHLRDFATFFAKNENRSPTMIIVRRLCLDVSFMFCVITVFKALWRRSGVRRREVRAALVVLWRAILGSKPERLMVDRGV